MAPEDVGRISVMLPVETISQIDDWATAAGVKRGPFVSMAMVIGARVLARQSSPELFFTPEIWRSLADGMGITAEQIDISKLKT